MIYEVHPLCDNCMFEEGQNFMIIDDYVYKLCNLHSEEYVEIYCNHCELFHLEPNNIEICTITQQKFLDISDCESSDSNQDMGMEEIE